MTELSNEQKQYLAGFVMGQDVARTVRGLPVLSGGYGDAGGESMRETVTIGPSTAAPAGLDGPAYVAQTKVIEAGGKLSKEEQAKRERWV